MKNIKPILPVLISACLLLLLSFGYRAGFGLFLAPMSEAHGWGRDVFSLALAVQNLAWGLFAVFAGGLADRHGILKVLLGGAACYGLGMWLMADSTTDWAITSTAGLLVGAGVAGTAFGIVLPALARAVPEERRAWALGIGTAAGSLGQFLLVPIMQQLIDWAGWYQALQILGLSAVLMAFCAISLVRHSAAPVDSSDDAAFAKISLPELARRAFQVPSYTLLVFGFFVCGFHVAFITVHMPGYLVDLGFDPKVGAWSISLIGLCNVIGAYMAGVISSRYPMHKLLSLIYLGRVVAITVFLVLPVSLASVLAFSALMGFLWLATVPPTSGLVARFFGTRYMTFLYGIVFFSHQLGSFSGVWLGGFLYETFGNYDGIWYAGILLGLLAAFLHWPIADRDHSPRLQTA
ncbi:Predicted arabinose efflux permease, MFS family [Microbulbifer donghaiensis]|uniref:Predicted arabinose efflux permease, MFS family n=1 Tax=Microbulbifer donghaiensis TaxID=494016 RepID=A0A1M4XHZ0_9GAMM|nr:MFS transporter [Microbulbifer donghaiensis]SHE92986.1 Predicted arabinose efflux permease, MFS family [Microbulbifer donghaiensis]